MVADPASNIVYAERRAVRRVSAYAGSLAAQRVVEHEHPEIQFVVGLGTETVEATWHDAGGRRGHGVLRPGEVAIIASGQPHTFAWRETVDLSCVYVETRHLDELDEDGGAGADALASCYGLDDPLARELVIALAREAAGGMPFGRLYAEALEQSLLLGAVRRRAPIRASRARPSLPPRRLAAVLDYIEQHFAHDIGLAALAAEAGMSRFHFAHAFKAATGFSPCRFVRDRRIDEAKRLLRTNQPLATIAASLGFADQSHFAARFRAAVGVAPNAYRKAGIGCCRRASNREPNGRPQ